MTDDASGLTLVSLTGTRYRFDPGALSLEFLTTGGPGPVGRRYEALHRPADLAAWLALSRLRLDPARVEVDPQELATARRLRDALWRLACARTGGRPPSDDPADFDATPADLATLNEVAAGAPLVPELTAEGSRRWALPARGGQALATIARDAVDLFSGPYAGRIRECGAHNCHLVFVDTSRPGQRRWCSMERCGNRHKVRSLRARRTED
ncbi:CGNR zinc finger domain-containing protein [Micromonospora costi]|uniref:CGNR zinc finger domain-containing protein n=1 Tax=Micromonospora costi TaxID=1530042 RepID=UPI0019D45746|nr:ABATE domain-containing protein [Micromonospora costi]